MAEGAGLPCCRSTLCWPPRGVAALRRGDGRPGRPAEGVSASPGWWWLLNPSLCSKQQGLVSQQSTNDRGPSENTLMRNSREPHATHPQLAKRRFQKAQCFFLHACSSNHAEKVPLEPKPQGNGLDSYTWKQAAVCDGVCPVLLIHPRSEWSTGEDVGRYICRVKDNSLQVGLMLWSRGRSLRRRVLPKRVHWVDLLQLPSHPWQVWSWKCQ